ncbi:M48 family metallopeptidase [Roseofilum casamattae]|uniref:M48 family metallopeptidase n=1 Tax=Roseofilum casamattae BLCC-M143 TaxID=3022442 RepID=A0ABT7BYJ2_9CYAN|nr:M48 family metallopeptidase [Roseofilum casamattae]MDJ1184255.1 M48 family metallopeptidase [Roseofilum casamattae BLCC-M143]
MNFFEHQDRARRQTVYLIFLFAIAIIGTILALYAVFAIAVAMELETSIWQPELLVLISLIVIGTVTIGSAIKLWQLRAGGKIVAFSMGGRLVNSDTQDLLERRLLNVVEEMAIASGVSVPPVYLMDYEPGINAFAAGFTINDAVIGVTRGSLEQLSREQLQGVIAHEFSHIIHGDMRLNLYLIGVVQGILLIHLCGRELLRLISNGPRSKRKKQGLIVIAALALFIVGYIGFICGRLIKSAIGRQREFLADASAVQYTRNPWGISGALRQIGGLKAGSNIKAPKAEEASHLFFGEAVKSLDFHVSLNRLLATHPPLQERIKRLENLPDGALSPGEITSANPDIESLETNVAAGFQPAATVRTAPGSIVTKIGSTHPAYLNYARSLLAQLPEVLQTAVRKASGAEVILYGLLLNFQDTSVRDRQISHLKQTESPQHLDRLWQVVPDLRSLDPHYRLPLVDLAIPPLREISPERYSHIDRQIEILIQADGKLSLSEYSLQVVFNHRLAPYFNNDLIPKIRYTTFKEIGNDCAIILSGLAEMSDRPADAFNVGIARIADVTDCPIPRKLIPTNIISIRRSLKKLVQTSPKIKQTIVDACAYTVLCDRQVRVTEAELLRTIIILLDCPIPPFLEDIASE